MRYILTIILSLVIIGCHSKPTENQTLTVAFASCNNQNLDSLQIWQPVLASHPDYFIWTGDIIYPNRETPEGLKEGYGIQKSNNLYQDLTSTSQILGIFDDHDYAMNDGGVHNPYREDAKQLLFEFLDEPTESARSTREGIYDSYTMADGLVKTILLDTRWFRSDLKPSDEPGMRYQPSDEGTMLGSQQWEWLASELSDTKSQIVILVSSIQFLNDFHAFEKWGNFPHERQRLIDMLTNTNKQIIVLSGDRHFAELSKLNDQILEVTSSGMTHTYKGVKESNPLRVGPLIDDRNFGILKIDYNQSVAKVTSIEIIGNVGQVLWGFKELNLGL